MRLDRLQPELAHRIEIARRGAEQGEALGLGIVEQLGRRRMERRAVIEAERRPAAQRRGEPVPHHPAAGGEVEHPIALVHVAVQPVLLQMLQQRAAGAMDDAFGFAGGAGREQDEQRVAERQPREPHRPGGVGREERVHRQRAGDARGVLRGAAEQVDHQRCRRRQRCRHLGGGVADIDELAVIVVAVDRHEQFRGNLAEAVEHAARSEIGRAG